MKIKRMVYTKDNGDMSNRIVVIVSEPREHYLTYDISSFTEQEIAMFEHYLKSIEDFRAETFAEFEDITGKKVNALWRSFKPGGIEWVEGND